MQRGGVVAEERAEGVVGIRISVAYVSSTQSPMRKHLPLADLRWNNAVLLNELVTRAEAERRRYILIFPLLSFYQS